MKASIGILKAPQSNRSFVGTTELADDPFRIDGKVALVTGALGVLGKTFCRALAANGASVAVVDLDDGSCARFADEIRKEFGCDCVGIGCDVANPASAREAVDRCIEKLGGLQVLHNNAATKTADVRAFFASFEDYAIDTWREVMRVNVDGMFLMAQAAGAYMSANGGGSIVQTSSIYGVVAPDQRIYEGSDYLGGPINTPAVYSTSKAAVLGLTRHLATYWATAGIRVNSLTPGGVASGQNNEFARRYSARVPLGRMAVPNDLVGALIFLASDASSYVTGQNFIVDGGLSVW
jgi:NAD(P)-dependent dehydrogenase (short-subunit alcohol dehydrogenase family)